MDPVNIATILVATIAALGAWASARAASRAQRYNADASIANERMKAETEAFNRARAMDDRTIKRQDEEIDDIRAANAILKARVLDLEIDNERLRKRVVELERKAEDHHER